MKKIRLEIPKKEFAKYHEIFTYFENLSYFKSGGLWITDIFVSNEIEENLIDNLFKKIKKKIMNVVDIDWVKSNFDSDKLIRTKLFSFSQGLRQYKPNSKYHIIIPANTAFGTGNHNSTLLLIKNLETLLKRTNIKSCLDLGAGSGILSFVLKKYHIQNIIASDNDKKIISVIEKNRKKNNLNRLLVLNCDGFKNRLLISRKFDLIVANLFLNLLKKLCSEFFLRLKKGGYLVISGIVKEQLKELINKYLKFNFKVIKITYGGCWVSVVFKKKNI